MPSGRTHDAITLLLAAPAFAVGGGLGGEVVSGAIVSAAFIFGGLMFGPDLDTVSRQYSRWFIFRFIWFPYRSFFKHRSRFSHGLLFGALIRVIYFLGMLSLIGFVLAFFWAAYVGMQVPVFGQISNVWSPIGEFTRENFGAGFPVLVFAGLWLGAASHTFTDMAGSFIKTGRVAKFL